MTAEWTLALCTDTLLREIADTRMTRRDVAMTYRLAMDSAEATYEPVEGRDDD